MTDRADFRKNVFRYFHGFVKIFSRALFSSTIGAFHWALRVVWFTYPMKNRVCCVKAQKEENDSSCMTSSSAMAVVIDPAEQIRRQSGRSRSTTEKSSASVIIRTQKATAFLMPQGTSLPRPDRRPRASVAADQNGHFHRMHLYPQCRHNGDRRRQRRLGDLRDEPRLHQHLQGTCKNAGQRQPYGITMQRIP